MRRWIATLALACVAACAAGGARDALSPPPVPGVAILIIEPDVQLSLLTVNARKIPRADWSAAARMLVAQHVRDAVQSKGRTAVLQARADVSVQGRQILLLHDAVLTSIRISEDDDPPPTLSRRRTWTLGVGARALGEETGATHALIVSADGEVTSAARAAFVVGAAAMGVLAHTGLQRASASLVDLETGDIVWRNAVVAAPDQDMRDPDGAHRLVTALLNGAPL
ncbi:MAG: hypothetical protein IV086_01470 [Hyphomonadaceae bacterium]|nr:MAG: hypothetical protein FD160_3069 [Caulobacteraceae bacterium]MBT9444347.1 hypothetical protein [Hyphomonadaceae bacterium]TPW06087.1 MAG: hypothetical protein FD124_1901 [Alphaproteobacteria bacterium]